MRRNPTDTRAWTCNQIVAFNLARARLLRGWTQYEAGQALAPYLGQRLSAASWSAMERSIDGGRVKQFSADELLALARGFDLPIGWFLTPPSRSDDIALATPDHPDGIDPALLLDAVLGTPQTLEPWRRALLTWPSLAHRARIRPDGTTEHLGRVEADVHTRLDDHTRLHAQMLLRSQFGDLDAAHDVVNRLGQLLIELDEVAPGDGADE